MSNELKSLRTVFIGNVTLIMSYNAIRAVFIGNVTVMSALQLCVHYTTLPSEEMLLVHTHLNKNRL